MSKKSKKRKVKAEPTKSSRMYQAAKAGRLDFTAQSSSADAELYTSLKQLRDKSRALTRDNVYAQRAKSVVVTNVIGGGVGMQAQVRSARAAKPVKRVNEDIEKAWKIWERPENCHTGATLNFSDLERMALGEIFEAGEVFIRLHPSAFGPQGVPLALEVIESERIADDQDVPAPPQGTVTMGIEHDEYGKPIAYYVYKRNPSLYYLTPGYQKGEILRIPADQMIHIKLVERWPQVRGVPFMHSSIRRINQLGEYEHAALVAARIGASKVGFFEPQEWNTTDVSQDKGPGGQMQTTVEAGEFTQLPPGWTFNSWDPNYPHENFDPFTRASLRGIAAGVGVSYESLSRDYSQSNYSSSRLALLDDRDLYRVLQQWWIRTFREPLHRFWMQQAVMSGAIPAVDRAQFTQDPERFVEVRFKPRGWGWVDPSKEVSAYKEAEKAGYITKGEVIAATAGGLDLEDVVLARRRELDMLEEAGLSTDTTVDAEAEPEQPEQTEMQFDNEEGARLRAVNADD